MELTLRKERESQEKKDRKVLEILRVKDGLIDELRDRCVGYEEEVEKRAREVGEWKARSDTFQVEGDKFKDQARWLEEELQRMQEKINEYERGAMFANYQNMERMLDNANAKMEEMSHQLKNSESEMMERDESQGLL